MIVFALIVLMFVVCNSICISSCWSQFSVIFFPPVLVHEFRVWTVNISASVDGDILDEVNRYSFSHLLEIDEKLSRKFGLCNQDWQQALIEFPLASFSSSISTPLSVYFSRWISFCSQACLDFSFFKSNRIDYCLLILFHRLIISNRISELNTSSL